MLPHGASANTATASGVDVAEGVLCLIAVGSGVLVAVIVGAGVGS